MSFYDVDLHAWTTDQASLLRAGRVGEADLSAIAEALDDISKTARRALPSPCAFHWYICSNIDFNPTADLDAGLTSSTSNVTSPELARFVDDAYRRPVRRAASEPQVPESAFPSSCPWTAAQITRLPFFPEA